jgi:2-polyprenyl-3-methyl-5-hydroxy-6-metoxy-1,4-benzoquinol methylase
MSNYTENQFVSDENNSWSIIIDLINEDETILDIGCSSGNFGAEIIKRKKCIVDGIDIDSKDVKLAKGKLRRALLLNIETDPLDPITDKYDAILMVDVIEHLVHPVGTLKRIASLLKPGGRLLFSVPNMAHVSVRLDLLQGDLDYRKVGLLDDTHLHFYTEKTLLRVLSSAGYSVEKALSTTITYPKPLLETKLNEVGLKATPEFSANLSNTKGNVYQFVGDARPTKAVPKKQSFPNKNPHEIHFKQVEKAINDQTKHIHHLESEIKNRDEQIQQLHSRLDRIINSKLYRVARSAAKPFIKSNKTSGRKD